MYTFRCDKLFKSFDGVHAVDNITLEFPSSGITAIIGPNGAGKTTLVNILTGFLEPNTGRCFLGPHDITKLPPHRIAQLGVARTFQDLRLITQVSLLECVMLCRPKQRGEKLLHAMFRFGIAAEERYNHEEAIQLLDLIGLAGKASDMVGELSYGQQKLLSLACCLATDAPILVLDEPFAGVSSETTSRILELLRELRDSGKLIMFIEHNIEAVREVADLVIVMDHGRILIKGPAADILRRDEVMEAYFV